MKVFCLQTYSDLTGSGMKLNARVYTSSESDHLGHKAAPTHVMVLQVVIDVQQNPFEKHRVAVLGECYMEALAFEGLPQESSDELRLPDIPLNQTGRTAFALRNMSDKPYRYMCCVACRPYNQCCIGKTLAGHVMGYPVADLSHVFCYITSLLPCQ